MLEISGDTMYAGQRIIIGPRTRRDEVENELGPPNEPGDFSVAYHYESLVLTVYYDGAQSDASIRYCTLAPYGLKK